jgi:hypothetical protein
MLFAAAQLEAPLPPQRGHVVRFPRKGDARPQISPDALAALCEALEIEILPTSINRRRPGQTHAGNVMLRILRKHGAGHLTIVLRCIVETGNAAELRAETIWAISDCILARPDWEKRGLAFLEAFDAIDLRALRQRAKGILPRHGARVVLGVLLWERLREAFGEAAPDCVRGKNATYTTRLHT